MAVKEFCDMCGKEMPTEGQLKLLAIGDKAIGDLCLACGQGIQTVISKARYEASHQAAPVVAPPASDDVPVEGEKKQEK